MTPATTLGCPVCGAPRQPATARCDYCGSWLLVFPPDDDNADVDEPRVREHIDRLRSELKKRPEDVAALHGLGVGYRSLGLLDDATRVLTRAANMQPESLNIQRALAGTLFDAVRLHPEAPNMWRDVRRQADRIIALDAHSVDGWRLRAEVVLQSGADSELIALAPNVARHAPAEDLHRVTERLTVLGDAWLSDWRWDDAVDAWEALGAVEPLTGRARLVAFLLQNSRLVTRSDRSVWRALRQTLALRGDFRQSTMASLALGVAVFIVMSVIGVWLAGPGFAGSITIGGMVVWPLATVLVVRTWLVGWPPVPVPKHPWRNVSTEQMVATARSIAPRIERVRPRG